MNRSRSKENLEEGKLRTIEKRTRIDLGLAILASINQNERTFSRSDIALFCGCSDEMISYIERNAINKIRKHII